MASVEERLAVLETQAKAQGELIAAAAERLTAMADKLDRATESVSELSAKFSASRAMVAGAMSVLGVIVGTVGFLFKSFLDFIVGNPTPPQAH